MGARRFWATTITAGLVLAACGGGSGTETVTEPGATTTVAGSPSTAEPDGGTPAAPTTTAWGTPPTTTPRDPFVTVTFDPEAEEYVEVEAAEPGPATYEEVLDAGVDAGIWDEVEGLTRLLGFVYGEVPGEQVPGAAEVLTGEITGLLERAHELSLSGEHAEDDLAGLRRRYELAIPPADVMEQLIATALPQAAPAGRSFVRQAVGCAPVDPADFSGWAVIEGCYAVYEGQAGGATVRVFFPAWYGESDLADLPVLAFEALVASANTYSAFAPVGDMDLIFSLVDTTDSDGTLGVASHDANWGVATTGGPCPITVFPSSFGAADAFQQTVAHEAWHCVQRESGYPDGVASGHAWYIEGGAEYFSNVVYPDANDEHGWLERFDSRSLRRSLLDMKYEAWIWWQFLANRTSPGAVADLQLQIMRAGDGGAGIMAGYGELFQRFVVEYIAGTIRDANGANLPEAGSVLSPTRTVGRSDAGKELSFPAEPFVAARYVIKYDQQLRVLESDITESVGEVAMVENKDRRDPDAWTGVHPEVRSTCEKPVLFILVATTHEGSHTARIKVDEVELAVCDPCLIGTWDLDLPTFKSMLLAGMASQGGVPPGVDFDLSGHYYMSLDDQGAMTEQRDGLTITAGAQGFSFDIVIDAMASGDYTADGERIAVMNVVDQYVNVRTSLPGAGNFDFSQEGGVLSGGGTYECRRDDMTVTIDGFDPVRWVRVDKILEPPPTTPP